MKLVFLTASLALTSVIASATSPSDKDSQPIIFNGLTSQQANAAASYHKQHGAKASVFPDAGGSYGVKVEYPRQKASLTTPDPVTALAKTRKAENIADLQGQKVKQDSDVIMYQPDIEGDHAAYFHQKTCDFKISRFEKFEDFSKMTLSKEQVEWTVGEFVAGEPIDPENGYDKALNNCQMLKPVSTREECLFAIQHHSKFKMPGRVNLTDGKKTLTVSSSDGEAGVFTCLANNGFFFPEVEIKNRDSKHTAEAGR